MKTNFSDSRCRMLNAERRREKTEMGGWSAGALAVTIVLASLAPVHADLPAPDNILYGIIVQGTNQVLADATGFAVEARRTNGLLVARCRMGESAEIGNHYLLTLKVEEIAPRIDPASLLLNESVTVALLSNDVELVQQTVAVTERGAVRRLDFGTLPDSFQSGFELWALAHGLDANSQEQDADGDGVSNVSEYIAGSGPTNDASRFTLRIGRDQPSVRVSFDAQRAEGLGYEGRVRHYALERLVDPVGNNWQAVAGYADIVGADQEVAYVTPMSSGPIYFRGRVWLGLSSSAPEEEFQLLTSLSGGQRMIWFTAHGPDAVGQNRYYSLECSTNLYSGTWSVVPGFSNLLGNNQTLTNIVPSTGVGAIFYRGKIELRNP